METYIRLRCNQAPELVEIDPKKLLDGFYQALDCDCIETVHIRNGYLLILDEVGKLRNKEYNQVASTLYDSGYTADWIAGDALIARIGFRDDETDIVPLGKHETELMLAKLKTLWAKANQP